MTDETTTEKIDAATNALQKDIENDIKVEKPTVEAHLEAFGAWTWDELKAAESWIARKL